jgi:opacity protein-like surface antigen
MANEQPIKNKPYYGGIAINAAETYSRSSNPDFTGFGSNEYTNMGLTGILGYEFMEYDNIKVFLEGRIGKSVWMEDSEDVSTTYVNLFLKPTYGERIGVYGLIGGSYVKLANNDNVSKSSFSLGLGAFAYVKEDWYIFADYTFNAIDEFSPLLKDYVDFDVVTIGLLYKF